MKDVTAMYAGDFGSQNLWAIAGIHPWREAKGLQDQELRLGALPTEMALGIHCNIEDKLGLDVNFKDQHHTKHGILSMVSWIYNPLGLVSLFVPNGRQITQMLCLNQFAWDDPVDEDIQQKWIKWIKLNGCYKPRRFEKVVSCSLHYFADASASGYGQETYLRLVKTAGKVHCSLVIKRSRVAPLKYTSIPRLALAAA